jgi:hypothetical protein
MNITPEEQCLVPLVTMNTSSHLTLDYGNITANMSMISIDGIFSLSELDINDWTLMNQGAFVVVVDMSLAIISVMFNLMVITSIKEREDMLGVTFNLVLLNLCSSNLLSAVMVKSISIVLNAYAVASNSTQSDIAFCIVTAQLNLNSSWE